MRWVYLALATFWISTMWPQSSMADGTLAVGIPPNVNKQGSVWGYGANDDPDRQALAICRGVDVPKGVVMPSVSSEAQRRCTIVGRLHNQCYAIAHDAPNLKPATSMGWGIQANLLGAEDRAIDMCKATAAPGRKDECRVTGRGCDGSAK
jgi:hypothetical protein